MFLGINYEESYFSSSQMSFGILHICLDHKIGVSRFVITTFRRFIIVSLPIDGFYLYIVNLFGDVKDGDLAKMGDSSIWIWASVIEYRSVKVFGSIFRISFE